MAIPPSSIPQLQDKIRELVKGNFDLLEADGRAGRLTASQLREAIHRYGRHLVDIPTEELVNSYDCPVDSESQQAWIIEVDLWTAEEGKSDLTLSVLLTVRNKEEFSLEITDLHVL